MKGPEPPPSADTLPDWPMSRGLGGRILGAGVLLVALNGVGVALTDKVSPLMVFFTPLPLSIGLYMLVVGTPIDPATGKQPRWAKNGLMACLASGLLLGIIIVVGMSFWFSAPEPR